jgi:hypothetical protein
MRILKGFKSCVLKVRIPKGLWVCFAKGRILKSLEGKTEWAKNRGAEASHLQRRERELRRKERPGEGEDDWIECDESMEEGGMVYDYCQGLLFKEYHSNETGGSREI